MNRKTAITIDQHTSGIRIVHVQGDLDSMGTHMVSEMFEKQLEGVTSNVVVNLQNVSFISSAGMALLLQQGKTLNKAGGKLVLAAATSRVIEVLTLAGFHELFDVYDTVDAALTALNAD